MKRLLLLPVLMTALCGLTPGQTSSKVSNPFVGTWKANLKKSQRAPNHQFKSLIMRFKMSGDTVIINYAGVNMAGKEESDTREMHPDGKEYPVAQAPGAVQMAKWSGSHILEATAKKDEKVIGQSTYKVSRDGRTLTATIKGIDAKGASFEQVIVLDRQ
jgi:hypothetical protein